MDNAKPEVLSPVGSQESLTAAVRAGADAVYLGLGSFNARRNAENFDMTGLREAVAFCHIRGVKVYLTVNIILTDKELPEAVELASQAANCGVDGLITADIGFADVLHRAIPTLPIHASTQMSVHSPSALLPLSEMGFCRVVAAREMSRSELTALCEQAKALDMEIEVFVHGALCMCLSGQCLLSAMLGGRSGNRGLCAGPCRLPFAAENGTGYDLSLKDLSLISHLGELAEMGVASLKIEGRMKRPEYVAAATAAFRSMLDTGTVDQSLSSALQDVFSRSGFTDGYFTGKRGKTMFGIRTKEDATASPAVFARLHELYRKERQSVRLTAEVAIKEGKPMTLALSDGIHTVTVSGEVPEPAVKVAADADRIAEQLCKTGGTPYRIEEIKIELDDGLSVRASALNALRREATEKMDEARSATPIVPAGAPDFSPRALPTAKPIKTVVRIERLEQLDGITEPCAVLSVPLEADPEAVPSGKADLLAVDLPRGIADEQAVFQKLKTFKANGFSAAFCGTLTAVELAKKAGLTVFGDFGLNVFNSSTAATLRNMGLAACVLSPEMLLTDAVRTGGETEKGIISYGRLPLMITRNCPIKNGRDCANCDKNGVLTDRKKVSFPVRCRNGFSELLNSRVIWLADRQSEMEGLDFQALYFTDETPDRVGQVIRAYRQGLPPDCDHTRGLYFRGVE